MAFYVAKNNLVLREQSAEGNGCLYLMGTRTKGNSWVIRDRKKGAVTPEGKERRKCFYPEPSGNEVRICQASATITNWRGRRGNGGGKREGRKEGRKKKRRKGKEEEGGDLYFRILRTLFKNRFPGLGDNSVKGLLSKRENLRFSLQRSCTELSVTWHTWNPSAGKR